eukprot:Rhum_TRINITY_DN14433_c40_g1::Rhum_TRINITY_DN14433_c40_g1_i1::g.91440::m.91440
MSVVVPNAWVRVVHPRGDARLRVVCFPHAGGSAGTFAAGWDAVETLSGLPVEVCAVCLPGRAERAAEAPPAAEAGLARLAEEVARGLEDSGALALPTAFYGHSLGALLAFEVAARLEDAMETRSVRPPVHIFASAAEAPAHLRRVRSGGVDAAGDDDDGDDAAFVASLERYGVL